MHSPTHLTDGPRIRIMGPENDKAAHVAAKTLQRWAQGRVRVIKDYYHILGVAPDATPEQIKSAYRKKAKELHPDYYGRGSEPFLAVHEAYKVLADPERRQVYDHERSRQSRARRAPSRVRAEPLRPQSHEATRSSAPAPWPAAASPLSDWPLFFLFQEFLDRPWRDPQPPVRDIHIEVTLSREQARRGGRFRLWVPAQTPCPDCRGRGWLGFFECPRCLGSGLVDTEYPVPISFEAGIVDGSAGQVSLDQLGLHHVRLIVHFRVTDW